MNLDVEADGDPQQNAVYIELCIAFGPACSHTVHTGVVNCQNVTAVLGQK